MKKPKIGLLPMYIKLYDDSWPEMRARVDAFHQTIVKELSKRGIDVLSAPVCRIKPEFEEAVRTFEAEQVDAIVTLHLAYSPSLESSDVLATTKLPLIILDTTPEYDFTPEQDVDEILYNHGIHGVQDMCNLLIRNKKVFSIEAGHWDKSDVLDRISSCIRAARLATCMKNARVGRIGKAFAGMGDFDVPAEDIKSTIGVETVNYDFNGSKSLISEITEEEIKAEIAGYISEFYSEGVSEEVIRRSAIAGLAVRRWVEKEKLTAFTVNFLDITGDSGLPTMPFVEASKAMARGIGYAGEGDVLTAALTGAIGSVYSNTSFTEMFCPDWKNNSIFLSHMGEMNIDLAAERPVLVEKDFPFTDVENPAVAYARFREGRVVFANLAPGENQKYSLVLAEGYMLRVDGEDKMKQSIHGWFKPKAPIQRFLADYSKAGGTHHAVLVYDDVIDDLVKFGEIMGWKVVII